MLTNREFLSDLKAKTAVAVIAVLFFFYCIWAFVLPLYYLYLEVAAHASYPPN